MLDYLKITIGRAESERKVSGFLDKYFNLNDDLSTLQKHVGNRTLLYDEISSRFSQREIRMIARGLRSKALSILGEYHADAQEARQVTASSFLTDYDRKALTADVLGKKYLIMARKILEISSQNSRYPFSLETRLTTA